MHLASVYCTGRLAHLASRNRSKHAQLTERERECLRWVAAGKTDWETSRILSISEKTAQEHVRRALGKLNASTRAQAVALALASREITL